MAYFHGVRASEVPTSVISPVSTTAGLPVVFGTAPVHLTDKPEAYVNKPVICYSWDEAVAALGYSGDWDKYTLCEAMYTEFKLYAVKPIILVNVLDPAKHKAAVSKAETALTEGVAEISEPILLATLKVFAAADSTSPVVLNVDYTAAYDDDGKLIISAIEGGAIASATKVYITYDKVDADAVTSADIISGASRTGTKGLE